MDDKLNTSYLWLFIGSLMILIVCMVNYYAKKDTKLHVKFLTILSWFFCFGAYAVLPIDIYYVRLLSLLPN